MANVTLTHDMIAERALFDLKNSLTVADGTYKGYKSEYHADGGFKKGSAVRVQLPNRYRAKKAIAIDLVETEERSTTVTVDTQAHVALSFTAIELTLDIESFSKKHLKPAMYALANVVDVDVASAYKNIHNQVGTPGTTPATMGVITDAAERLDNEAIGNANRSAYWSPAARWGLANGDLKGLFNENLIESLVRQGLLGRVGGIDHFMDQNMQTHTTGLFTTLATPVMNGATAEGATTLVTDGWNATSSTVTAGDVFTIAAVVGVNPVSGAAWENNELRQFVCTAAATSTGGGDMTISIAPTIYSSAAAEDFLPYQTVVTLPQNGAALTFVGTESTGYKQNLVMTPEAIALTMVPIKAPQSAGSSVLWGQASDEDLGLSISIATDWDQTNYAESTRLDILYGVDVIQAEYAVRVTG